MKIATFVPGILLSALVQTSVAQTAVYRCVGDSGVVYTDRPCATGADPHEIDDSRVTVYTPPPAVERASAPSPAARPKTSRAKAGRAADPARHRLQCAKLDQALRDVRTKMRSGYGAKEGERLKARQRQLTERRRTQKCG